MNQTTDPPNVRGLTPADYAAAKQAFLRNPVAPPPTAPNPDPQAEPVEIDSTSSTALPPVVTPPIARMAKDLDKAEYAAAKFKIAGRR